MMPKTQTKLYHSIKILIWNFSSEIQNILENLSTSGVSVWSGTTVSRTKNTDCGKPFVEYLSHKLNLEGNKMISDNRYLDSVIMSIHDIIQAAKAGIKNDSLLRNLTSLKPLVRNLARWTDKCYMVSRFMKIRAIFYMEAIIQMVKYQSTIAANFSKNEAYGRMLSEINIVIKSFQTKETSLSSRRMDL